WRLVGSDGPYRTNPVHHPQKFLRGHPFNSTQVKPIRTEPSGDAAAAADKPNSGPTMLRVRPDDVDTRPHRRGGSPDRRRGSPVEAALATALRSAA
ncbi:MAG TPA: hypothetical protein PK331_18330, partial [Gordonia sp. (in: high G+C Gram-positive bacteria)]|nr:hypothetical protein [Gordonia sp. (in: high G+C Gram-positive bacteria)]HRC52863.1 hypothetical protein [Gordonia sp. (in: high G+C Gram-positive bacteria)]